MGGSVSRTNCPNGIIEKIDPKPTDGSQRGVTISGAKECARCVLEIPPNISSSTVKVSRTRILDTCPAQYVLNGTTCKAGTITLPKDPGTGLTSKNKITIKPSIPFQFTFNGTTHSVPELSLYHPCPFRIENIQADAALVLMNPTIQIVIPIQTGATTSDFLSNIAANLRSILIDESTGQYLSIDVPTGSNWDLTKAIPVDKEGHASVGFFMWKKTIYKQKVTESKCVRRIGWEPVGTTSNTILIETPMTVSQDTLAKIIAAVPSTESERAEEPVPPTYVYKGRQCKTCRVDTAELMAELTPEKDTSTLMTFLSSMAGIIGALLVLSFTFWASTKIYANIDQPILSQNYVRGVGLLIVLSIMGVIFASYNVGALISSIFK